MDRADFGDLAGDLAGHNLAVATGSKSERLCAWDRSNAAAAAMTDGIMSTERLLICRGILLHLASFYPALGECDRSITRQGTCTHNPRARCHVPC